MLLSEKLVEKPDKINNLLAKDLGIRLKGKRPKEPREKGRWQWRILIYISA